MRSPSHGRGISHDRFVELPAQPPAAPSRYVSPVSLRGGLSGPPRPKRTRYTSDGLTASFLVSPTDLSEDHQADTL